MAPSMAYDQYVGIEFGLHLIIPDGDAPCPGSTFEGVTELCVGGFLGSLFLCLSHGAALACVEGTGASTQAYHYFRQHGDAHAACSICSE